MHMSMNRFVVGLVMAAALAGCQATMAGKITPGTASPSPAASAAASPAAASPAASPAATASTKPAPAAKPALKPAGKASGVAAFTATHADAKTESWVTYKADKFGFEMAVPDGTELFDADWGNGWGGLYAKSGEAEVFGVANLGAEASWEDIEAFGVAASEIPADKWTKGPEGGATNGWKDWRSAHVTDGKDTVIAIYGHGPKGNYLLFLKTSNADLALNTASYEKWGDNVKLF